jgi:hypothetical protein
VTPEEVAHREAVEALRGRGLRSRCETELGGRIGDLLWLVDCHERGFAVAGVWTRRWRYRVRWRLDQHDGSYPSERWTNDLGSAIHWVVAAVHETTWAMMVPDGDDPAIIVRCLEPEEVSATVRRIIRAAGNIDVTGVDVL